MVVIVRAETIVSISAIRVLQLVDPKLRSNCSTKVGIVESDHAHTQHGHLELFYELAVELLHRQAPRLVTRLCHV